MNVRRVGRPAGDSSGSQVPTTVRFSPAEREYLDSAGGPNRVVRRLVRKAMADAGRLAPQPVPAVIDGQSTAGHTDLYYEVRAVWLNRSGGFDREVVLPDSFPGTASGLSAAVKAAKALSRKHPGSTTEVAAYRTPPTDPDANPLENTWAVGSDQWSGWRWW